MKKSSAANIHANFRDPTISTITKHTPAWLGGFLHGPHMFIHGQVHEFTHPRRGLVSIDLLLVSCPFPLGFFYVSSKRVVIHARQKP